MSVDVKLSLSTLLCPAFSLSGIQEVSLDGVMKTDQMSESDVIVLQPGQIRTFVVMTVGIGCDELWDNNNQTKRDEHKKNQKNP